MFGVEFLESRLASGGCRKFARRLLKGRAKSLAMSTDYHDSAASVNIGAIGYRRALHGSRV
jgi:hypothetical protein